MTNIFIKRGCNNLRLELLMKSRVHVCFSILQIGVMLWLLLLLLFLVRIFQLHVSNYNIYLEMIY